MDLIDRKQLISALEDAKVNCADIFLAAVLHNAIQVVEAQPSVEAVVLPCKLGDSVFTIGGKYRAGRSEQWINPGKFRLSDLEKMGKSVFLTHEEAEAALAKMGRGAEDAAD